MLDSSAVSPRLPLQRLVFAVILIVSCLACTIVTTTASAGKLDLRAEYAAASGQYKSRVRIDQSFPAGLYAAVETTFGHSNALLTPLPNTILFSGVEPEMSKSLPLRNTLKGYLGAKYRWTDKGATIKPSVRLSWSVTPVLKASIGYRYERRLYETKDLNGNLNHDDIQRIEVASEWSMAAPVRLGYNIILYLKQNDYTFSNQRKFLIEQNLKLSVIPPGGRFTPYLELGDVGDYINTGAGIHARQLRLRLGVAISFLRGGLSVHKTPRPPAQTQELEDKPGME